MIHQNSSLNCKMCLEWFPRTNVTSIWALAIHFMGLPPLRKSESTEIWSPKHVISRNSEVLFFQKPETYQKEGKKKNSSLRKLIGVFITFPTATNPEVPEVSYLDANEQRAHRGHSCRWHFVCTFKDSGTACWLIAASVCGALGHKCTGWITIFVNPASFTIVLRGTMEPFGTLVFQQRWLYSFHRQGPNPLLPLPFAELSPFSQMDCSNDIKWPGCDCCLWPFQTRSMICWWTELRLIRFSFGRPDSTSWLQVWQDLQWCLAG